MKTKQLRAEIKGQSVEELRTREKGLREENFKLRFQHGTRQLENTAGLKNTRKEIARVLTAITEKERKSA